MDLRRMILPRRPKEEPEPLTSAWYRWLPRAQLRELADDDYPDNMIYVRAKAELARRASARLALGAIAVIGCAALAAAVALD